MNIFGYEIDIRKAPRFSGNNGQLQGGWELRSNDGQGPYTSYFANYIARKVETNTRELEGAMTKIQGYAMLNGGKYDIDVARSAIATMVREGFTPRFAATFEPSMT